VCCPAQTCQSHPETNLVYEDNGVGIPEETKGTIFSEGFTTGRQGLGLKLVKRMIEAYGWTIREDGVPGKGAQFVITIPRMQTRTDSS
jgi:signal transduction histidine kinase